MTTTSGFGTTIPFVATPVINDQHSSHNTGGHHSIRYASGHNNSIRYAVQPHLN